MHAPRRFIAKLRNENELFNNHQHQDAHEFLNYLLNEAAELLEKRAKKKKHVGVSQLARRAGWRSAASCRGGDETTQGPTRKG